MNEELILLKKEFLDGHSKECLKKVLDCLVNTEVLIPKVHTGKGHHGMHTDLFKNEKDDIFYPIFSNEDQLPAEYKSLVETEKRTAADCMAEARALAGVKCLVLDPFTDAMVIPYDEDGIVIETEDNLIDDESLI